MLLQGVMPHPVEEAQLRIAVDRYSQLSIASPQTAVRVRGTLSHDLLDMVRLLPEAESVRAFGSVVNLQGVFVQYTFALRAEEVRALLTTSIQRSASGEFFVTQRRAKAARGGGLNAITAREIHYGSTAYEDDIAYLVEQIVPTAVPQPLLPGYNPNRVNDGLKIMARRFGWNPAYQWTTHALRFGSIADAWSEAAAALVPAGGLVANHVDAILDQVRRRSAHLGQDMALFYTLTADERADQREAVINRVRERLARDDPAAEAPPARGPTRRANRVGGLRLTGQGSGPGADRRRSREEADAMSSGSDEV
jgi:hypothetical protein